MKKLFAILLSTALLASLLAVCTISVGAKTWEDDQTIDEAGDYIFDNAYGFVFNINYVDGVIAGEDVTLITNATSYESCNPNWAISIHLAATDVEGQYEVIEVVSCPGSAAAANITWGEGDLVLVAHSAYSNPNGTGYQAKCAAVALKAGDLIAINAAQTTATVSNEDGTFPAVDDTSKEPDASEPSTEIVLKNLALGASYTTSQLYRQGGREVEWGWDANAPIAYPDEDGKSLTDGVITVESALYSDAAWAGFHAKAPDYEENGYSWITVDLGEAKDISNLKLHVATSVNADNAGAGIAAPATVEFLVSTDGENFESLGVVEPANEGSEVEVVALAAEANAQYVQVRMTSAGWMFVSEVEVEGYVETETENSGDTSTEVPAGDASNMIVFAVIALVAIAGTAVVIKSR